MRTDVPRERFQPDLRNSIGSLLTVCELTRNDAASRIQQLAETGTDPGVDGGEEITSPAELLADAASRDLASPRKLTIRNLLLHWGRTRRTSSAVSMIADDLAEAGLTTRPPFAGGHMEDEIEIVPTAEPDAKESRRV
jgi:restriction system protein